MRVARRSFVAAALAASLVSFTAVALRTALAEDAPEDAATLLRKGRAAESIERDVEKAIAIYRRLVDGQGVTGAAEASRDAGLRLFELLEVRGDRAGALSVAQRLSDRYGTKLDDDGKRRVHEAMARLLPAGSHARSPLGDIYVVPGPPTAASATADPAAASTSPLDAKVLALLSRLDGPDDPQHPRFQIENEVLRDIAPVGKDALPALERMLRTERLERAQFAAKAMARIGGAASAQALATALKVGDGFTRSAALAGLQALEKGPETSEAIIKALYPLYSDPQLADVHAAIRDLLGRHYSDDELLSRHAAGGPDANAWLRIALFRQVPAALSLAEQHAATGAGLDASLIGALEAAAGAQIRVYGPQGPDQVRPNNPSMGDAARLQMLRAVAAQPPTTESMSAVKAIALAVKWTSAASTSDEAATIAWRHVLAAPDVALRSSGVRSLLDANVAATAELGSDDALMKTYVESLEPALLQSPGWSSYQGAAAVARSLHASAAFWREIAGLTLRAMKGHRGLPLSALARALGDARPPPESDALWLEVVRTGYESRPVPAEGWLLDVAARSNDHQFADLVRRTLEQFPEDLHSSPLVDAFLRRYRGPERSEVVIELIRRGWNPAAVGRSSDFNPAGVLAQEAARGDLWTALAAKFASEKVDDVLVAARVAAAVPKNLVPPKEVSAAVIAALRRADLPSTTTGLPFEGSTWSWWPAARWARNNDLPEFLTLLRERSIEVARGLSVTDQSLYFQLWSAFDLYQGPGRLDFLRETMTTRDFAPALPQRVPEALAKEDPRDGPALVVETARDPDRPMAAAAVDWLSENRRRAQLVEIVVAAASKPLPTRWGYASALAHAADAGSLEEAIPWLLRLVKEAPSRLLIWDSINRAAGTVIDSIHARHADLARYESYARGAASTRSEIESHLSDADPEIRRAAILALSALGDRDVLARLLALAKEEKDPRVRQAALDAIERIAKGPASPAASDGDKPPAKDPPK